VKLSLLSLTVGNNFDRLLGGYQTLRPRLTKYYQIPGGVDAYENNANKHPLQAALLHIHEYSTHGVV